MHGTVIMDVDCLSDTTPNIIIWDTFKEKYCALGKKIFSCIRLDMRQMG